MNCASSNIFFLVRISASRRIPSAWVLLSRKKYLQSRSASCSFPADKYPMTVRNSGGSDLKNRICSVVVDSFSGAKAR